jgi:polyisoprenoid-binding protein YceI
MVSGKDGLDKNMYKTMNTKEFPNIRFLMSSSQFGTARGDTLPVTANGTLTITGQQRTVAVKGQIVRAETGVWLEGTHPMKMSDFGIKPPKMMMGTIKVHDPIVVRYRLLLVPGEAAVDKAATHQ